MSGQAVENEDVLLGTYFLYLASTSYIKVPKPFLDTTSRNGTSVQICKHIWDTLHSNHNICVHQKLHRTSTKKKQQYSGRDRYLLWTLSTMALVHLNPSKGWEKSNNSKSLLLSRKVGGGMKARRLLVKSTAFIHATGLWNHPTWLLILASFFSKGSLLIFPGI